jgi:exodeoxyribonuclease VIII
MIDKQMPADAYFAHPAVNKSLLDLVGKAPSLAQAFLAGTYSREKTASMKLGSLVHALVLEPDTFSERYALAPEGDRRTKAGKEAFEQFLTESEGKDVITSSDYETAQAMAESVREHPSASLLLREGDPEVSVFAELAGTACKCRIDWLRPDGILVDLKTTKDASSSAFARSCASFDYPVQAAMYLDLTIAADVEATDFVFIAIESPPPYLCATYSLTWDDIAKGRALYQKRLEILNRCRETNDWPGLGNGLITTLKMPAYWGYDSGDLL